MNGRIGSGTQTDEEYTQEQARRNAPWTVTDYETVRQKAIAVGRSYRAGGVVDGPVMWQLLGALDRVDRLDADDGAD